MKLAIVLLALVLIGTGLFFALKKDEDVTPTTSEPAVSQTAADEKTSQSAETSSQTSPTFTGTRISGNYYEYSAADYQTAKAANRPIFLFFYANWCPTCAAQEPIVKQLMTEIADESKFDDIVAFRVNFNDNATSKDEEQLANEFGVRYQHTMFVLDENGKTVKKFLSQTDAATLRAAFAASVE